MNWGTVSARDAKALGTLVPGALLTWKRCQQCQRESALKGKATWCAWHGEGATMKAIVVVDGEIVEMARHRHSDEDGVPVDMMRLKVEQGDGQRLNLYVLQGAAAGLVLGARARVVLEVLP